MAVQADALVTVVASDVDFTARLGETVFEAARRHGFSWPTVCGGRADCTRCFMEVLEGGENLGPMGRDERAALEERRWRGAPRDWERLACRATVHGAVTVRRRSVRILERSDPA